MNKNKPTITIDKVEEAIKQLLEHSKPSSDNPKKYTRKDLKRLWKKREKIKKELEELEEKSPKTLFIQGRPIDEIED